MNRFEKLWEGSVKVRIDGRGMERFFNIAAQRGIVIEKIETKEIPAAEYDGNRHDRYDNHVEKKELEKAARAAVEKALKGIEKEWNR